MLCVKKKRERKKNNRHAFEEMGGRKKRKEREGYSKAGQNIRTRTHRHTYKRFIRKQQCVVCALILLLPTGDPHTHASAHARLGECNSSSDIGEGGRDGWRVLMRHDKGHRGADSKVCSEGRNESPLCEVASTTISLTRIAHRKRMRSALRS